MSNIHVHAYVHVNIFHLLCVHACDRAYDQVYDRVYDRAFFYENNFPPLYVHA